MCLALPVRVAVTPQSYLREEKSQEELEPMNGRGEKEEARNRGLYWLFGLQKRMDDACRDYKWRAAIFGSRQIYGRGPGEGKREEGERRQRDPPAIIARHRCQNATTDRPRPSRTPSPKMEQKKFPSLCCDISATGASIGFGSSMFLHQGLVSATD